MNSIAGTAKSAVDDDEETLLERGIVRHPGKLELELGESVDAPRIAFEILGAPGAPVLMVLGGISASCHVTSSAELPEPGWWEAFAGAGKAIDTTRYRVLSMDFLGGNGDTEGPRNCDGPFPSVSPADQARLAAALLDELGIRALHAFIGASYGGMVALQFAALFPGRIGQLVIIGAAHRAPAIATALRSVQREAIRTAIRLGSAADGLRLARAIGMVTYRSADEFEQRFSSVPENHGDRLAFPVEGYLFSQGDKFARRFHPEAILRLSESIDLQQLEPERIAVPTELFCARSDFVAPPQLMAELAKRISGPVRYTEFDSLYGHDSFLKETGFLGRALDRILQD